MSEPSYAEQWEVNALEQRIQKLEVLSGGGVQIVEQYGAMVRLLKNLLYLHDHHPETFANQAAMDIRKFLRDELGIDIRAPKPRKRKRHSAR